MKRWIKWVAAAVLLLALAWLMVGRDYHESAAVVQDGVTFYPRADRLYAFAGIYTWDGAGDTVEYVIPDQRSRLWAALSTVPPSKSCPTAGVWRCRRLSGVRSNTIWSRRKMPHPLR